MLVSMEWTLFPLGLLLGLILGAVGAVLLLRRLRGEAQSTHDEDDALDEARTENELLRDRLQQAELRGASTQARLEALEQRREEDAAAAR